jgi:hypothetical protein
MDKPDQRIYLLEAIRELDYKIIERKGDDIASLEQQRDKLKGELHALLGRTA